eukprot:c20689_g1_i1 orf=3-233(-)
MWSNNSSYYFVWNDKHPKKKGCERSKLSKPSSKLLKNYLSKRFTSRAMSISASDIWLHPPCTALRWSKSLTFVAMYC